MTNPIVQERKCQELDGRITIRHYYWCEGCDSLHGIAIAPSVQDNGASWTFSGTLECPTYSPSQLSSYISHEGKPEEKRFVCHTFIRSGMVEFLGDCTHAYAGQARPMVPLPDWFCKIEKDTPNE